MRGWSVVVVGVTLALLGGLASCGSRSEPQSLWGISGAAGGVGLGGGGGVCSAVTFVVPTDGAKLGPTEDLNGNCADGFQTTVKVATNAPNGTQAALSANGSTVATTAVSGNAATFDRVQLDSNGSSKLNVRIGNDCQSSISVQVACSDITCSISKPVISNTHPMLNGEPAPGGDRVSAAGSNYQVAMTVTTNAGTGQLVTLKVDNGQTPIAGTVSGMAANFAGVTLIPDGDHTVQATCYGPNGKVGTSALVTFTVDTKPPDLTILRPSDGQFFGPGDDADPTTTGLQIAVCGSTTANDALNLSGTRAVKADNFCVAIGTATPKCTQAKTFGIPPSTSGGCINVTCPGGVPFDLNVTLYDAAGNKTAQKVTGVACASSLPSVQIVKPVDGTGTDPTTHILAASMTQPVRDEDASKAGAQYTVVACSSVSGSGRLLAGPAGATLSEVANATTVTAQASDRCPAGYGYALRFPGATLPESAEDSTGALVTATELVVEVTGSSTALGTSPAVDVWVDSSAPTLSPWIPLDLCGKLYRGTTPVDVNVVLTSPSVPVTMTVTRNGVPETLQSSTISSGRVDFGLVNFAVGTNQISATTTELSGNTANLQQPCVVTVGNPPLVTWVTPTQSSKLNAATDADPSTPGWQGTLTIQTDVGGSGGTVTFTTSPGTTSVMASIDAAGVATAANVTIQDGASVTITATTSDIPGRGVGTASLSGMVVDTIVPGDVTGLSVSVTDRRQTTFHLSWIAPSDGGQRVASYQVRVSKSPINAGNFDAATAVIYSGSPQSPGSADGVDVTDQLIETDYYFAVAAVDAAGNRGTIATTGPAKATFNTTILNTGVADDRARAVDGSESVDGDTFSDLVVGVSNGNAAYLYRGGASGYSDPPSVTFSGNPGTRFGADVAVVGDIDGDGMKDIAVSATLDGGPGTVYIFKGRASWPATLGVAQADYIIRANAATEPKFTGASLGVSIARLGDFNGDGADDFAIGAHRYNSNMGFVAVILGVTAGSPFPGTVTLPSDYGTRAIAVEGEDVASVTAEFFGQYVLGLGKFYTTTGNTLVVGAPGSSRVYAFRGQLGPTVLATAADHVLTGVAGTNTGRPLALIGQLSGNPVLGVGAPAFASNTGSASLYFGNPSVGPFGGTSSTFTDSAASSVGDAFGVGVIGSGFSGTVVGASFIGSNLPDVILSSIKEGGVTPANLYFLRGENVNASGNVVSRADIIYKLPAGWVGVNPDSGPIKDLNGDGYADIAIGEFQLATGYQGRVLVLW